MTPHRSRVWIALFGAPFILGATFIPLAAYLATTRGLEGDALKSAIEPLAVFPATVGFSAVFLMSLRMARRDGLDLHQLGWGRPSLTDLALGVGVGAAVHLLNMLVLHPLIRSADPSFDPRALNIGFPALFVTLALACIAEDTLYRGYAFVVLRERHGLPATVAITSVFYALITPAGPPLILWALGFGVVLAVLRARRRSLWPVTIAHALVGLGPRITTYLQT